MKLEHQLKKYRKSRHLTQAELAEASGISIKTIQRIEKGLSTGSAYTLKTLANALKIDPLELQLQEALPTPKLTQPTSSLKWLNLSALSVIFLPLSNLIFPGILFFTYKNEEKINTQGRKILSFQLLWTLITFLIMIVGYGFLCLIYPPFRGAQVPMYVPIYFIAVVVNCFITLRTAIKINAGQQILGFIPSVL